jgi:5-methylcytosine-specific restriction endonuclease McrA
MGMGNSRSAPGSPNAPARQLYGKYRHRCKTRNVYFDLTLEQFIQITTAPCEYCAAPPTQRAVYNRKYAYIYNGIDRKDNRGGYYFENCVPACGACNSIKGSHLSHAEMLAAMSAVKKLRGKPSRYKGKPRKKVKSV